MNSSPRRPDLNRGFVIEKNVPRTFDEDAGPRQLARWLS